MRIVPKRRPSKNFSKLSIDAHVITPSSNCKGVLQVILGHYLPLSAFLKSSDTGYPEALPGIGMSVSRQNRHTKNSNNTLVSMRGHLGRSNEGEGMR